MSSPLYRGNASVVTYTMTDTTGAPVTTPSVTGLLKDSSGVTVGSVPFALSGSSFVGEITAAVTAALVENANYTLTITATGPDATIDVDFIARRLVG